MPKKKSAAKKPENVFSAAKKQKTRADDVYDKLTSLTPGSKRRKK